ncbi:hypothetical protein J6590_101199 [Homalodisca vitripennis]|nr:hypothetical protein J6590_101199 [Homalodisca vitripennis]
MSIVRSLIGLPRGEQRGRKSAEKLNPYKINVPQEIRFAKAEHMPIRTRLHPADVPGVLQRKPNTEPGPPDDTDEDRNYDPGQEEEDSSESSLSDGEEQTQSKRTRKRLRIPENWKRNKAKLLQNSGKAYTDSKGNQRYVLMSKNPAYADVNLQQSLLCKTVKRPTHAEIICDTCIDTRFRAIDIIVCGEVAMKWLQYQAVSIPCFSIPQTAEFGDTTQLIQVST